MKLKEIIIKKLSSIGTPINSNVQKRKSERKEKKFHKKGESV